MSMNRLDTCKSALYLNNAATSFPKPMSVVEAVRSSLMSEPKEPGRTGGDLDPASHCREALAVLFEVDDPLRIALLPSATFALNLAVTGLLKRGGHALTTELEHNSMLRPIHHVAREFGAHVTTVSPRQDGRVSFEQLSKEIRSDTRLIALTHVSNVTGIIQPVEEISRLAADKGIPLLIDAAQSAGVIPVSARRLLGRTYIAFAGHKGLYGPTGVGGLVVPDDTLPQWMVGGTGIRSESLLHPKSLPLRHEAGTPNLSGLEGLAAGVRFVMGEGLETLAQKRAALILGARAQLSRIPGVRLSPLPEDDGRAGIVSFTVAGHDPDQVGFVLRESFGISVRTGLHCAPLVHRSLASLPTETVRASVGAFNSTEDIDRLTTAIGLIACP